jgi:hypothetical protein
MGLSLLVERALNGFACTHTFDFWPAQRHVLLQPHPEHKYFGARTLNLHDERISANHRPTDRIPFGLPARGAFAIMSEQQANEAEKNIEIWKVKKLIKRLEAARGNGTSMISLIIRKSGVRPDGNMG